MLEHSTDRIGLGARHHHVSDDWWPTYGYDGQLAERDFDSDNSIISSGVSREEWITLGEMMVGRWMNWLAYVKELPDGYFTVSPSPESNPPHR